MQLSHFVRYYPEVLDRDACQQVIDHFEAHSQDHVIHQTDHYRFAEVNVSAEWPEIHKLTFEAIFPNFSRYANDIGLRNEWPDNMAFEQLRLKRYLPNDSDQFPDHVDVHDHESARRFLVAFLYLNDVEEGGCTEFPSWGQSFKPCAGSLLMFPPLWPWLHAGRKPITGPKYILGTYLHYI